MTLYFRVKKGTMFRLELIMAFILALAASEAWAFKLDLKSTPDKADIFVRPLGNSNYQRIGETPYTVPIGDIVSNYVKEHMFVVELRKEGFTPYRIIIADIYKMDIELEAALEPNREFIEYRKIDKAIGELFDIQRMLRGKEYDSASKRLTDLEKDFPHMSVIPEMLGGAYYLQKKNAESLGAYKKAIVINPENRDSYNMKLYLEKALGIRKPADVGGK